MPWRFQFWVAAGVQALTTSWLKSPGELSRHRFPSSIEITLLTWKRHCWLSEPLQVEITNGAPEVVPFTSKQVLVPFAVPIPVNRPFL